MGKVFRVFAGSVCVAAAVLAAPEPAAAQGANERARAKVLHEAAFEAVGQGRYGDAARGFDAAWSLDPHPDLLWNAARAWHEAGMLVRARARYRRYLTHEGLPPDQRLEANDHLVAIAEALRARAEHMGRTAGAALAPTRFKWGVWTARAERRASSALAPGPSTEKPAARRAGWALVGMGAAVAGTGAVFYGLARRDHAALTDQGAEVGREDLGRWHDTRDDLKRNRALTWTFASVGAAAIVGGVVTLLVGGDDEPETRGSAGTVGFGPTRGGGRIMGSWGF